jgi:hypothetical protein
MPPSFAVGRVRLLRPRRCIGQQPRAAALPILAFWLGLMLMIWLFLLDIVHLVSGHFTVAEIALTVVIAVACTIGFRGGCDQTGGAHGAVRVAVALIFATAQMAALVLSMMLPHTG